MEDKKDKVKKLLREFKKKDLIDDRREYDVDDFITAYHVDKKSAKRLRSYFEKKVI